MSRSDRIVVGVMFLLALVVPNIVTGVLYQRQQDSICDSIEENREALFVALDVNNQNLGERFEVSQQTIDAFNAEVHAEVAPILSPIDC